MKISAEYFKTIQSRLDIIANNLANVQTPGFKSYLLSLEESYDAQDRSNTVAFYGGLPAPLEPVVNPNLYVGRRIDFSQGSLIETGNPFDLAIQGEGFFQVRTADGQMAYTRAGTFSLDGERNLVNNMGLKIEPEIVIPSNVAKITIDSNGTIYGEIVAESSDSEDDSFFGDFDDFDFSFDDFFGEEEAATETNLVEIGVIPLFGFDNPDGLEQIGNNLYRATAASGEAIQGTPGNDGFGVIRSSMLEKSNTDLLNSMTSMLQAQRAYQIEARVTQTQDQMIVEAIRMRG